MILLLHPESPRVNSVSSDSDTDETIMQSEKEEQIIGWLGSHGVNDGWKLASELVNVGITVDALKDIAKNIKSSAKVV